MVSTKTLRNGLRKGLVTTWEISKVTVPLYIVITFLKYSGLLEKLAQLLSPAMGVFGLPGEAAVPLVSGYLLNLYAAIGAMLPLQLDTRQTTILALMLCFAHSLLVEGGITKRTGIRVSHLTLMRLALSLLAGVSLNLLI